MKPYICRACPFEIRADSTGDGFTLEGYAAVFNKVTRIDSWEGLFDEKIARGAFAKTIAERKPVMQFDHGHDVATGTVPIGAIEELSEDRKGLFVRARLHDNPRVEPIRQAIVSGAIDGMSFRFRVVRDSEDKSGDVPLRTIQEVELFELGPVVFPAYEATTVGVRSLLAGLTLEDQGRLVAAIRADLEVPAGAAPEGTPTGEQDPDAAPEGTSGATPGQRAALLRQLLMERTIAA